MNDINRWLNNQPYNITVTVSFGDGVRDLKDLYCETADSATRQNIRDSIVVDNELARMDFLEEEIQTMLTYPDAERIIKHIQGGTDD